MDDIPLEPLGDGPVWKATVIDLAGVRLRHGRTAYKDESKLCAHRNLIFSTTERRVWCEDCNRTIDSFDAVVTFSRFFEKMIAEVMDWRQKAWGAMRGAARLRATKALDRIWSGNVMAVQCPHCKGGLLPEDFANGANSAWSRELEIAERRKSAKQPQS